MPFTIKNILTEDEIAVTKKIRDTGAYDWTRKRKAGEEDYSISMHKISLLLKEGLNKKEIAKKLQKRYWQVDYIIDLLIANQEHPTLSKKEQARRTCVEKMRVISRWKFLNKEPENFTSHNFRKLATAMKELEQQTLIKEGKKRKVA